MKFKEDLLHYIWKYKRFNHSNLRTIDGQDIHIENYGFHNHGSGPDFHNGRVTLDNTEWAGNIELHIKSLDWKSHNHQKDKTYDNVILHVVYEYNGPVYNTMGQELPTLELKSRISADLIENYIKIVENTNWIPCAKLITDVDPLIVNQTIDRALTMRLARKSEEIFDKLKYYNNDWNKVCYESLAGSLGAKINRPSFEHLSRSTPLEVIRKCGDNLFQIEAILFGQAGLLDDEMKEGYPKDLSIEYQFLKHKFGLVEIKKESWQFSGLRPSSFPHVRIAQFAKILFHQPTLFARIKTIKNVKELDNIFNVKIDGYWLNHYNFKNTSKSSVKRIGKMVRNNLMINTIVPLLFNFADTFKDDVLKARSLTFLENLKAESNGIIKKWEVLGVKVKSASESQGLLELKNECCTFKKCLECPIGVGLLKN